jgi:hypothetical protein
LNLVEGFETISYKFSKNRKKRDNPPDGGCFFDEILFLYLCAKQFWALKRGEITLLINMISSKLI